MLYHIVGYFPQVKNIYKLNFVKDILEYHNIKFYIGN
jgi:hypothetical protein